MQWERARLPSVSVAEHDRVMTTAAEADRSRTSKSWQVIGSVICIAIGVAAGTGCGVAEGQPLRTSLMTAFAVMFAMVAYALGYRRGRRDYEVPHPTTSVPPPKGR